MSEPLTKRQKQIFDFLVVYQTKWGVAPTLREIADSFKFKSATAQYMIGQLTVKGYIKNYPKKARGLEIING